MPHIFACLVFFAFVGVSHADACQSEFKKTLYRCSAASESTIFTQEQCDAGDGCEGCTASVQALRCCLNPKTGKRESSLTEYSPENKPDAVTTTDPCCCDDLLHHEEKQAAFKFKPQESGPLADVGDDLCEDELLDKPDLTREIEKFPDSPWQKAITLTLATDCNVKVVGITSWMLVSSYMKAKEWCITAKVVTYDFEIVPNTPAKDLNAARQSQLLCADDLKDAQTDQQGRVRGYIRVTVDPPIYIPKGGSISVGLVVVDCVNCGQTANNLNLNWPQFVWAYSPSKSDRTAGHLIVTNQYAYYVKKNGDTTWYTPDFNDAGSETLLANIEFQGDFHVCYAEHCSEDVLKTKACVKRSDGRGGYKWANEEVTLPVDPNWEEGYPDGDYIIDAGKATCPAKWTWNQGDCKCVGNYFGGDPHVHMFSGDKASPMGEGEFIVTSNADFAVHACHKTMTTKDGAPTHAATVDGVAIKTPYGVVKLLPNQKPKVPEWVRVNAHGDWVFPHGEVVRGSYKYLSVDIPDVNKTGKVMGLMGAYNPQNNFEDAFMNSSGVVVVKKEASGKSAFHSPEVRADYVRFFQESYRVAPENALFTESECKRGYLGSTPTHDLGPRFWEQPDGKGHKCPEGMQKAAEEMCPAGMFHEDCLHDVLLTCDLAAWIQHSNEAHHHINVLPWAN